MGSSYTFTCTNCGYQEESSGKLDSGMMSVVEPHICNDCNEITDVLVEEYGHKIDKSDLANKKKDYYLCSTCSSENIILWDTKLKPCPKCETKMKKGQEAFMWD